LTARWQREVVGTITYVIQPGLSFRRDRATAAAAFVDSVAVAFEVPRLAALTYYMTRSVDDVYRIMGLETDSTWGAVGGVAQPVNRQLFSGMPSIGEAYRHELAHMVLLPLVRNATHAVSEGVATWLGGTTGMDFPTATSTLARYLRDHPGVTLDSILTGRYETAVMYPAGAVLVDLVFQSRGTVGVKALFDTGVGSDDFRRAVETLLGQSWDEVNEHWRARVVDIAAKRPRRN
jgi:hypothetical protein